MNWANAQIIKTATWSEPQLSKNNPAVGETIEILYNVTIIEGWYLYSSDFDPDLGPIVTTFEYEGSDGVEILGKIIPVNPKKTYDDLFGGDYTYFEPKGQFKQKIKITKENPTIKVKIEFQTCQHEGSCISDKQLFTFPIKTGAKKVETTKIVETNEYKNNSTTEPINEKIEVKDKDSTTAITIEKETTETDPKDDILNQFESIKNDIAKGKDGFNYVLVNEKWYKVPQENSAAFYKKYLMLGGNHEN